MSAAQGKRTKLLFVCSANKWRSPTAEALLRNHPRYDARSAGTSQAARVRITDKHIRWADRIFVMETRHRDLLRQRFHRELGSKFLTVLDIPDIYTYMDPDLVDLIHARLSPHLPDLQSLS